MHKRMKKILYIPIILIIILFLAWSIVFHLISDDIHRMIFYSQDRYNVFLFLITTIVSMLFGILFFLATRNREKNKNIGLQYNHLKIRLFIHCTFILIFLIQCTVPIFPVGTLLSELPKRLLFFIQTRIPLEISKMVGYLLVLIFPYVIHQYFVVFNFYGLLCVVRKMLDSRNSKERDKGTADCYNKTRGRFIRLDKTHPDATSVLSLRRWRKRETIEKS